MDGTAFPYMLFVMKTPLSDITGYTVVDIPKATWAVFVNDSHSIEETSKAIQDLTVRVYTEWLPTANYNILEGYDFEMYYDSQGKYYEELWIRVTPKNSHLTKRSNVFFCIVNSKMLYMIKMALGFYILEPLCYERSS